MPDEMLEVLDDVFDNGNAIPQRVSNRMLLAAVRKNYKMSCDNKEKIAEGNLLIPEFREVQKKTSTLMKIIYGISLGMVVLLCAITWHTGMDLGWFPPLP